MINLCSLNVNGMHSKEKRKRVIEWVKTHVCSIAFLQETHIDENIEKEIQNNSKFEIVSSHGTSASREVSILLNKSLNFAILDKCEDKDGRLLLINIQIDDTIFTLVCIYAPNCITARNAFFNQRLSRACIVHLVIKKTNWSYVKTMSCSGSHLGITINIKNTKFVKDLPMIDA